MAGLWGKSVIFFDVPRLTCMEFGYMDAWVLGVDLDW